MLVVTFLVSQNPFVKIDENKLAKQLDSFRKNFRIASISFSIFKGQNYSYNHATGYANLTKRFKTNSNYLYPLASLTKTITSSIINQLLLCDSISSDDKVEKYIKEFPEDVTISDLLTHQSHFRRNKQYKKLKNSHFRDVVKFIPQWRTKKAFNYTNLNYAALGVIIEMIYQLPYETVVQNYFKLNIDSTYITFLNSSNKDSTYSIVHNYVKKGWKRYPHKLYDIGLWKPAALAVASSKTMIAFLRHHMNQKYIQFISKNMAFVKKRRYGKNTIAKEYYGYGFRIIKVDDKIKTIYHNGFIFGALATMYYMPEYDIGFVALSNMSGYPRQSYSFSAIILSIVKKSIKGIDFDRKLSSPKKPE